MEGEERSTRSLVTIPRSFPPSTTGSRSIFRSFMILAASKTGMVLGMVNTGLVMMCFTRMGSSCRPIKGVRSD